MSSETTRTLTAHAERLGATAVRVSARGRDVVSWGDVARPLAVHSIRKSLISALYGQLHDRGSLRLDTTIGELGIDDTPALTDTEKTATIEDLLTARSGVHLPVADRGGPERPARGEHRPGEIWLYNNWDFNVLGNVYERLTGTSLFLAFERGLARPLQMTDWDVFEHARYHYRTDVLGGNLRYPNYSFQLSARDLLRVGELYLRHGQWQGAQLVSRTWIERSVRPQAATPLAPGLLGAFGYCWWIAGPDGDLPRLGLPGGTFSAFGFGGNFLTVLPAVDAVVCVLDDPAPVPAPSSPPAGVRTEDVPAAAYTAFLRQVVLELS
jgi:CubicO group peptidase (beta-lactamase class C family)